MSARTAKTHRVVAKLHKWLVLLVGLQIVLWIAGGFVMSFFDIEKVRGTQNQAGQDPSNFTNETPLVAPGIILKRYGIEANVISIKTMLGEPVYEIGLGGKRKVYSAETGELLSPISKETAIALAQADFLPEAAIKSVMLLEDYEFKQAYEYRGGPLPAWRINFDDRDNTHIYVSADLGRVAARRNSTWRLFDFFWMLHIMDYSERDDFNHPLLIIAALTALIAVTSGVVLIFFRFRKNDFRWMTRS